MKMTMPGGSPGSKTSGLSVEGYGPPRDAHEKKRVKQDCKREERGRIAKQPQPQHRGKEKRSKEDKKWVLQEDPAADVNALARCHRGHPQPLLVRQEIP